MTSDLTASFPSKNNSQRFRYFKTVAHSRKQFYMSLKGLITIIASYVNIKDDEVDFPN